MFLHLSVRCGLFLSFVVGEEHDSCTCGVVGMQASLLGFLHLLVAFVRSCGQQRYC